MQQLQSYTAPPGNTNFDFSGLFHFANFFLGEMCCCFNFPSDSLARSPKTPPAHRPHWPSQSPQNPVGNLSHFCANKDLTQRGKIAAKVLLGHFALTPI